MVSGLWAAHGAAWRAPSQVLGFWQTASRIPQSLLACRMRGNWQETLEALRITLLVTREYEHFALAVRSIEGRLDLSYLQLPHPSGLAVDRRRGRVFMASTRNPNQIVELRPLSGVMQRRDINPGKPPGKPLLPVRTHFLPGCSYLHDLAWIGGRLHGNAVGQNAVVRFDEDGACQKVWWPRIIKPPRGPGHFDQNYLQLNSIAAGKTIASSFFSASTDQISRRRPGHRNFAVDGRGVIFSGATGEVTCRGLTRPHSARLHRNRLWVANSGYGELGLADGSRFESVARFSGWTRGLCFHGNIAFVATSRVLPRFHNYAPGLKPDESLCGIHALDIRSGKSLGSIEWPGGNQIFAVDWLPNAMTDGFPSTVAAPRSMRDQINTFYAFTTRRIREPRRRHTNP